MGQKSKTNVKLNGSHNYWGKKSHMISVINTQTAISSMPES
jgi:hypothetical protein